MLIELPAVIGHRGAAAYAPENTLAAMKKAYDLGVSWVEFDVMLAKCGTPIVFHDVTVDRTTNGHGEVAHLSYAKLSQLDAGSWFSSEYAGERVVTFAAMIDCLAQYGLGANIEIKPLPNQDSATATKTIEVLQNFWPSFLPQPLISSFSVESLATVYALNQRLQLGLLLDKWTDAWQTLADKFQCISVHLDVQLVNEARIQQIKASQRKVLVYTVNDAALARRLWSQGVDSIFSDYPDRVL